MKTIRQKEPNEKVQTLVMMMQMFPRVIIEIILLIIIIIIFILMIQGSAHSSCAFIYELIYLYTFTRYLFENDIPTCLHALLITSEAKKKKTKIIKINPETRNNTADVIMFKQWN